jgi:ribonucleoside-triphosphate reductase
MDTTENRVQEIDNRIAELTSELERVEGTRTEIYTRIVGYYRSLKNWNRGKREEYNHRVTFRPNRSEEPGTVPVATAEREAPARVELPTPPEEARNVASYTYFYREHCPNCPPVRSFVEQLPLEGRMVDVDTGDGMAQAIDHQILSTPTVILMNRDGQEVGQAGSVEQLRTMLESAG